MNRLSRDLHPVAWWMWAVAMAAAASFTTNLLVLAVLLASVTVVVVTRRSHQPWGRSFGVYVWIGVLIVALRVVFRILLAGQGGGPVLLALPRVPLPDWVLGITLLGPLHRDALVDGFVTGLQLATIVICIGAANALANPKRLLASVPPALYEIGTALVVAVTVLPQLAESAGRVRTAQQLRAGPTGRSWGLRRVVVPVLEDALERSLSLAAGMDTRGYGRAGTAGPAQRRTTGALMLTGLVGVCVGAYAGLDQTAPRLLAAPMLVLGLVLAAAGFLSAGRRVQRTRYRPDRWRWPESLVAVAGLLAAVLAWWVGHHELTIAHPDPGVVPQVSALALVGALVGVLAGPASPAPREAVS